MVSSRLFHIVLLLLALTASQAALAGHDHATDAVAVDCQLCLHGGQLQSDLPVMPLVSVPPVAWSLLPQRRQPVLAGSPTSTRWPRAPPLSS